jgi:pimeloyl-ACP methyl ester carboxylesterase
MLGVSERHWVRYRAAGALLLMLLLYSHGAFAEDSDSLPRRPGAPREHYTGVVVAYDSLRDSNGHRLRLIITRSESAAGRSPAIFVAGWLSCDSVEVSPGTQDATQLVLQSLAQLPGFVTVRMDKPGVGDSEGDCAETDFLTELGAYRQAFRKLVSLPFVDASRVFVFGISNGGGFAPLVADGRPVKGYITDGGWLKTWFEHMLEIERRRLLLSGEPPAQLNAAMKGVERLYCEFLLNRQSPQKILAEHPELRPLWQGDTEHQYGRPVAYYQQLQALDLLVAWSSVTVPLLALHGEYDWIMSRSDVESTVALVNHNLPGGAQFVELPETGHTFEHYGSQQAAFAGKPLPFDPRIARRIGAWLEAHRN